jgi:hypothetical protein
MPRCPQARGKAHAISRTLTTGILPFARSEKTSLRHPGCARFSTPLDWHGPHPSQSIGGHALNPIHRESGVEAGGAWRFRPEDVAITIRTAAKDPSDGGFHPRLPRSRRLLAITDSELSVIAAAASIGLVTWPTSG